LPSQAVWLSNSDLGRRGGQGKGKRFSEIVKEKGLGGRSPLWTLTARKKGGKAIQTQKGTKRRRDHYSEDTSPYQKNRKLRRKVSPTSD